MELAELAHKIYALRNSDRPSQLIHTEPAPAGQDQQPVGVLLLKPSSGQIPVPSLAEILSRLVHRFGYLIRSVAWWRGDDIRSRRIMSLHYPGFHHVAHAGLHALSPEGRGRLKALYGNSADFREFRNRFGESFDLGLVRTPYEVTAAGISAEELNALWELDRSKEKSPIAGIQRLDEHAFSLALRLPVEENVPAGLRQKAVVLLNGFYAKLEQDFETRGCIAVYIQRHPASSTSWGELRNQFAGKTNPFQAAPDTVRGDAARGVLSVEKISMLANVIHLSADEREGRREVEEVWWEGNRVQALFGREACRA
jgi:hypothetical protein